MVRCNTSADQAKWMRVTVNKVHSAFLYALNQIFCHVKPCRTTAYNCKPELFWISDRVLALKLLPELWIVVSDIEKAICSF